jgi:hypothetical protein
MTPGGRGPRARVGQGPRAPKVEHHVPLIASGLVEARKDESGRMEEEDVLTTAAAMLLHRGRRWGDRDDEE